MPALVRIVLLVFSLAVTVSVATAAESPHWIDGAHDVGGLRRVVRTFRLDAPVERAAVRLAADFCTASMFINGGTALVVEPYCQAQDLDVTPYIQRGENELAIVVDPVRGPTAVALSFVAAYQDGRFVEIVTDGRWTTNDDHRSPILDFGPVRPELWGFDRRPATVSPFENYEQWKQTLDKTATPQTKFDAAPGFRVTTLRNAAEDEGSWIALAFDEAGRLTVSKEDKGLLRMTLADDRRAVTRVETIDVDLEECRGLVYDRGWLLANANDSKAMYRLKIDDAGRARQVQNLRDFPGEPGHGRNDLALGPRGALYSIHGDAVQTPGEPIVDRTSPLRESRRGPPLKEGYLLRTDLRGKQWELVCSGLRNPYGVAVHPNGDVFTYDADNEFDMGTPWYRPTRIVQLLSGADYGYRALKDKWTPNFPDHPDNGLPVIDVGRGSPTAAMFGTYLKFPTDYRAAMFALDWSYGRVLAVHVAPRGGGYRANLEVFLQGRPLNVTDVAAGPDGAMYLLTGGRKTQSALYRIEFTGTLPPPQAESEHERDCTKFAERQRSLRTKLEAFHGVADLAAMDFAWPYLSDDDPTIRHAARIAVEQLPSEQWRSKALAPDDDLTTALAGWMALVQTGDESMVPELLERILHIDAGDVDLATRYELQFLLRRCQELAPDFVAQRRDSVESCLLSLHSTGGPATYVVCRYGDAAKLRRNIALELGELGSRSAISFAEPLFTSTAQEDRMLALLAMRNLRDGWTPETRARYFAALNDGVRYVGGQGMTTFLDRIRSDAVATLSERERKELGERIKPVAVSDEPLPPPREKVREWTLDALRPAYADGVTSGDPQRGEIVFRDALCSRCHRSGLTGPAVGPDLTFVARRFSRHDILQSIVQPSLAVAEQYRNAQVVTDDGHVYVGRVLVEGDFRSETLRLNVDPLHPSKAVEVDKKHIEEYRLTNTSPMPQGLLDTFSLDEIRDLLAFLEQGAQQ